MNDILIRPLRFSADLAAMWEFLELLGLRSRIESERGGWVDMIGGRGMVALHDSAASAMGAAPGHTTLSFEADDIDDLKDRLIAAGYEDATIWDEAYGRVLSVTPSGGVQIWFDERAEDLYGYKVHDGAPDPRWSVKPRLTGADEAEWERFLAVLGGGQSVYYGSPADAFAVRIDLDTTEELGAVAERVAGGGYEVRREADRLIVADPDGQTVVVHGLTSSGLEAR
ncbi:VOC family protein [Kribbella monticola]|uniref:VOC family protein n=1 Tax=Kribbella monticola TaxID=2185285 RepID=UPI000DD471B6|nr:VOC family protein [Kribbella monticola]